MSLGMCLILGAIIIGGIIGVVAAVIMKIFGMESFSLWNHEWFGKDENKDDFYKRF